MNLIKTVIFIGLASLVTTAALADRATDEAVISKALGDIKPDTIEPAPIAGLYEVVIGTHVVYVSADGRYMLQGDLIDVQKRKSLTEPRRATFQHRSLKAAA